VIYIRRGVEWREPEVIRHIYLCALLQEKFYGLQRAICSRRDQQRSSAEPRNLIDISAMVQQQADLAHIAGTPMQRSDAGFTLRFRVRAAGDQKVHGLHAAECSR